MSLDEGVSRFIGNLYEAVQSPEAWRAAMHEMMKRTGSRMAFISQADVRHREYSRADFFGPDNSAAAIGADEYVGGVYETDPSLIWASKHPDAGLCDTAKIMPDDEFRRLEYVRWQESRFGTVHWRVFFTKPVDDLSFALSLHPPASEGPASKEQALLHRLLFEHMERALRLVIRPPDLSTSTEATIIMDHAGQVLTMSPRAEQIVYQADGLKVEHRRLRGIASSATERLSRAILSATNSKSLGGTGGGVRLPRGSGKPDWFAMVSPSPGFLEHLPLRTPGAIVRILETGVRPEFGAAHAALFDLSPREAEVAGALLAGHSLESLCHALGISRNTVKVHLQSIFRKTGTNRQSELVHLLSQVTRT